MARNERPQEVPTFETLENFLETERLALVLMESAKEASSFVDTSKAHDNSKFSSKNKSSRSIHLTEENKSKSSSCVLCKGTHFILNCESFESKTPNKRGQIVMRKQLCYNCLGNHMVQDCRESKRCQRCSAKHHRMLHFQTKDAPKNQTEEKSNNGTSNALENQGRTREIYYSPSDGVACPIRHNKSRRHSMCE